MKNFRQFEGEHIWRPFISPFFPVSNKVGHISPWRWPQPSWSESDGRLRSTENHRPRGSPLPPSRKKRKEGEKRGVKMTVAQ